MSNPLRTFGSGTRPVLSLSLVLGLHITGWAQTNGRNAIGWKQKFELDVWYVEHISFVLDFKILLRTVSKVFKSEGISSDTSATMEKFKGEH